MTDWIIPGMVVIAVIIVVVLYFSPSYAKRVSVAAAGPFDLSKSNVVMPISDSKLLLDPSQSSFQAFVYLNPLMRTGAHVQCGTAQNQPSCADGVFQPCVCNGADCVPCVHTGFYPVINLLGMAVLEVMPVPDAGRQGQLTAQLSIKTADAPNGKFYIETIPLPEITFQKWTMITIARDARQFSVYYNNTIAISKKTMFMPISDIITSNGAGILSGAPGLGGQLSNVNIFPKRLTILDVEASYTANADTRGTPYLSGSVPATLSGQNTINPTYASSMTSWLPSFKWPSFSLCVNGNCNGPAVTPPTGKAFYSSYA
jgi:hypothetical protein